MSAAATFPFGQRVKAVEQRDRGPKKVFVLGVYASAVHARWVGSNGKSVMEAVGVASEPEIFWRGENVEEILQRVRIPASVGRLMPAREGLNGPSGRALDGLFLNPLGIDRRDAWLCDLVPFSCMNGRQMKSLVKKYTPFVRDGLVPETNWGQVPRTLATALRRQEIEREFQQSGANLVITLGDQPLKWFMKHYGSRARLITYGKNKKDYGKLQSVLISGEEIQLLPLVHPRQAAGLGAHSTVWRGLHSNWIKKEASRLLSGS